MASILKGDPLHADDGTLNITHSGQNGLDYDLAAISNASPYTRQPLQIKLTRAPSAFKLHPLGDRLTTYLRMLLEQHAKNWTGFSYKLNIDTAQKPVGWDGQLLTTPTNIKRSAITPTATYDTLYNEDCKKFFIYMIETFYAHPSTQRPNFAELTKGKPKHWLIDQFTFDFIAFEPDPTFEYATKAWACAASVFTDSPELLGERNIEDARANDEYSMPIACLFDSSKNVLQTATALIQEMRLSSINPNHKLTYFETLDPNVVASEVGITKEHNEAVDSWLAPTG